MKPSNGSASGQRRRQGPEMRRNTGQNKLKENQDKILQQKTATETTNETKPNRNKMRQDTSRQQDIFGADITRKPENVLRIGCKNIHGFPHPRSQQVKYDVLRSESSENGFQFDLQSLLETNKRWNKVHHTEQIRELTKGWWEKPSYQLSWLRDHDDESFQFGGVATITSKYITSCRFKHGEDIMGRWTWVTLRGKRGIKTTIISTYRPCKSANEQSVEMQQLQFLRNKGDITDPHDRFDNDLKSLIEEKLDNEHKIILLGDFNVPITKSNKFTTMLKDLGLQEVITKKYQPEEGRSTYKHGNTIIDGIWTTDNIELVQGGYEDIFSPSGDHCWVWADFSLTSILGGKLDPFTKQISRKLTCKVPRVKEKYQTILEKEYSRHNLKERCLFSCRRNLEGLLVQLPEDL